jgi:XTP/dITP diphosphohydrolase
MQLIFGTHNPNKIREVTPLLPSHIRLLTPAGLGLQEEIPETGKTLEENALIKARYLNKRYGIACFADDTGLLVDALDGAPGVYSARYAGPGNDAQANMDKLLQQLGDTPHRRARFQTVIALVDRQEEQLFKGEVSGYITRVKTGEGGFGYDPIFVPEGFSQTFAELPLDEKNRISHRSRALRQLIDFLKARSPIS